MLVASDYIGGESELISILEQYFVFGELAGADLWTRKVLKDGHGNLKSGGCLADSADVASMLIVCAVGEIEASYVHSCSDELFDNRC